MIIVTAREPVWLSLRGYHVVALKPEFEEQAVELERAIHGGIPAYPDLTRADFYHVAHDEDWAYIHVYRDGLAVYLVAHGGTLTKGGTDAICTADLSFS